MTVSCPNPNDTCVCSSGVCCRLQAETGFAPVIVIIPYCDPSNSEYLLFSRYTDLDCRNNVLLDVDSRIICDDGRNLTRNDQFVSLSTPVPMNNNVYPEADSVSCNACESIRSATCQGPTVEI
jgi:hypothetical protein